MTSPVGLWVRADWRRRRGSLVALTVFAGLSFATVATVFAGARRTASSFQRLRTETLASDALVAIDAPGSLPGGFDHFDDATVDRIRALPQIESVGELVLYIAALADVDWEFSLYAPADGTVGSQIERARVLRGRYPSATSADEVAINEAAAERAHIDVGSVLTLGTLSPAQRLQAMADDPHAFDNGLAGPVLHLHVVGVVRSRTDIVNRSDPSILATPEFDRLYRGRVAYVFRVLLIRRVSGSTATEFNDAVDSVTSGVTLGVLNASDEDRAAVRAAHTLAVGLFAFTLIAALIALLVLNQSVARHVIGSNPDHPALTALGFTRAQRVRGAVANVAPVAALSATLAVVASYAASPLMPVGLAGRIEPNPGFRFDTPAALAAAFGSVVVVLGLGLLAALPATRGQRAPGSHFRRQAARAPRLTTIAASLGIGPVATSGLRLAFDQRRPALPVRSTLIGVGSAITVVIGALTFSASLDRLVNNHERWGYGWDLMLDASDSTVNSMLTTLNADHDLDGVDVLQSSFTLIQSPSGQGDPDGLLAWGLDSPDDSLGFALLSGVQPIGIDEVVIGRKTADDLHVGVGDTIQIASCPCTSDPATTAMTPVRVVGLATFPVGDDSNLADALGFSGIGFAGHVGVTSHFRVAVSVAPGRDLSAVAEGLRQRFPDAFSFYSYPLRSSDVNSVAGLRSFPAVLAAIAALLAAAALANMLITTQQRRRRELGVLRSLGFTRQQTRACVVWQGLCVTGVAVLIGITLGSIGGAGVWTLTTRGIGIATDPSRPLVSIAWSSLAALATAVVLGALIGAHAARARVVQSLHAE